MSNNELTIKMEEKGGLPTTWLLAKGAWGAFFTQLHKATSLAFWGHCAEGGG